MLEQDHIRDMVALATQEKDLAADLQSDITDRGSAGDWESKLESAGASLQPDAIGHPDCRLVHQVS